MTTAPEAAAPLPLKEAPLAAWQSQIRGGGLGHATYRICIRIRIRI